MERQVEKVARVERRVQVPVVRRLVLILFAFAVRVRKVARAFDRRSSSSEPF